MNVISVDLDENNRILQARQTPGNLRNIAGLRVFVGLFVVPLMLLLNRAGQTSRVTNVRHTFLTLIS